MLKAVSAPAARPRVSCPCLCQTKVLHRRTDEGRLLDQELALAVDEGDLLARGPRVLLAVHHHRAFRENDAVLLGEKLGPSARRLALALHDVDVAGGDHRTKFLGLADRGSGITAAQNNRLQEVAGELQVGAGDDHIVAEGDGRSVLVRPDHLAFAVAGDDGRHLLGRGRMDAGEAGQRERQGDQQPAGKGEFHLRMSFNSVCRVTRT